MKSDRQLGDTEIEEKQAVMIFEAVNYFLAIFFVFLEVDLFRKRSKENGKHSGISHASIPMVFETSNA